MLIACRSIKEIRKSKLLLSGEFKIKDLRTSKKIFGMQIIINRLGGYIFLT